MLNETKPPLGVYCAASSIAASQHIPPVHLGLIGCRDGEGRNTRGVALPLLPLTLVRLPGKCPQAEAALTAVALAGPVVIMPSPPQVCRERDKPQAGSELLSLVSVALQHSFGRGVGLVGIAAML